MNCFGGVRRESDLPVRSAGGADIRPSLNGNAATPPISSSVSCASSRSPEDRDRTASRVARLGARSTNLSLCSLNPIFRYLSTVVRSTKPANSTVIPLCVSDRHHHRGSHLPQIPRPRGIRRLQIHRHVSLQSLAIRPSSRARTESRVPPIPVRGRCHLNNSGRLRSGFRAPSCARPC
jgi:hypothetical protein